MFLVAGAAFAATKVLPSGDAEIPRGAPPVAQSSSTPSAQPPVAPQPDDLAIMQRNKLYTTGKLAPVKCKEPASRPTSKLNVQGYYQGLLVCMNAFWEPAVRKTGNQFHAPKLLVVDKNQVAPCDEFVESALYCDKNGGSVVVSWEQLPKLYDDNQTLTRIDMVERFGLVYSLHVQNLTGIHEASSNRQRGAGTAALRMEQTRRSFLQADCLSAAFMGAEKASLPLNGKLLTSWRWRMKHGSLETVKDERRNYGTAKSAELWMTRGFATPDPGSCNTFVAAAAEVS
jgi:predicted metalloprotease